MSSIQRKRIAPVSFMNVEINDVFWKPRLDTNRTVTIPMIGDMCKKSGRMDGYKWEWRKKPYPRFPDGNNEGLPRLWMGDIGKWIESAAYSLAIHPDAGLARLVEKAIDSVVEGQKADGYLYSIPIRRIDRWTNLRLWHEMYDMGHMMEGAVAYYRATGKRRLLEAACRSADCIDRIFGPGKGQKRGYDAHPEIELALVKLYRATGEKRYLKLAKFFVDERGTQPHYYDAESKARGEKPYKDYTEYQAHLPVRKQRDAEGHCVRALYLYSGMVDVAVETGDRALLNACRRLWESVTRKRMYVIGGVGSEPERFTFDYDLPNETGYAETCANVALAFFAHRMLEVEAASEYADVMERALYNVILSGISLDGTKYFYANHQVVYPNLYRYASGAVASRRGKYSGFDEKGNWYCSGLACCPPNIARLLASFGQYIYSQTQSEVYVHLYLASRGHIEVAGQKLILVQNTKYPWKGRITITIRLESPAEFTLALRIPGWCRNMKLKVNDKIVDVGPIANKGYAKIKGKWKNGDRVEMNLAMPVERIEANPKVRMDCGKVALQRGPVVYCLEEVDNGKNLADISLPRKARLQAKFDRRLFGGITVITGKVYRRETKGWNKILYRPVNSKIKTINIKAVPYCLWNNRKDGEMLVWIRED